MWLTHNPTIRTGAVVVYNRAGHDTIGQGHVRGINDKHHILGTALVRLIYSGKPTAVMLRLALRPYLRGLIGVRV